MKYIVTAALLYCSLIAYPQSRTIISKLELKVDTLTFIWPDHKIVHNHQEVLPFSYRDEEEVCEIRVQTTTGSPEIELIPAAEYELIDSMIQREQVYRFKIRFLIIVENNYILHCRAPSVSIFASRYPL